jgi:3-oxoacyl-[acyl-carrier protein] reductase
VSLAVVTGAGRGIGRATALAFAARGLDVALLGPTVEHLESVAHEVEAKGRRALPVICDVSDAGSVGAAAARVLAGLGVPDVLVNNAGIVRRGLVHEMSEEDWDAVVGVNLKGLFLVTRAFLPGMRQRNRGRVVVIGSISSVLGTARQSAYCASKWGAVGFTKSLAEELRGTGLAALSVLPGSTDTDMLKGSGWKPDMTAEDVASVVVYAALDAPSAMNGSAVEVFGP